VRYSIVLWIFIRSRQILKSLRYIAFEILPIPSLSFMIADGVGNKIFARITCTPEALPLDQYRDGHGNGSNQASIDYNIPVGLATLRSLSQYVVLVEVGAFDHDPNVPLQINDIHRDMVSCLQAGLGMDRMQQ